MCVQHMPYAVTLDWKFKLLNCCKNLARTRACDPVFENTRRKAGLVTLTEKTNN